MSEPETTDEVAEAADETVTDVVAEVDYDLQHRLWLKAIVPVLQLRASDSETPPPASVRVQFALDAMLIAACERAARILRSDVAADDAIES